MIKKIFLILILIILSVSCGKKGNPEYKGSIDRAIVQNIITKTS
tara:strand:- start:194 stop:325 length:132 start_codon:yes stop_codon:yes gene_type:complete